MHHWIKRTDSMTNWNNILFCPIKLNSISRTIFVSCQNHRKKFFMSFFEGFSVLSAVGVTWEIYMHNMRQTNQL